MKISVAICAHNEENWIGATLESLLKQDRPADEVIVVNNASTDRTAQVVEKIAEAHPEGNIRIVYEGHKGLHHARETGWRSASGDIIVATDADIRFPTKWLQIYEEEFNARPDIAAMSGPVRYYDALPFINWSAYFFEKGSQPEGFGKLFTKTYHVNGGNSAYRRSALEAVNGYLDKPIGTVEDLHIAAKLQDAHLSIRFIQRNKVLHTFRRFNKDGWRGYIRYLFFYTPENVYPDHLQDN